MSLEWKNQLHYFITRMCTKKNWEIEKHIEIQVFYLLEEITNLLAEITNHLLVEITKLTRIIFFKTKLQIK